MEKKKKLIIKVLTKLTPYRNLAPGILALVKSSYVDEKTIDGVIKIMAKALKNVKNKQQKSKLQQGIEIIKKIHTQEAKEKEEEHIDKLLENI